MTKKKKILIIHGPNLNLLGSREPAIYGSKTLNEIDSLIKEHGLGLGVDCECYQTNSESELLRLIQQSEEKYAGAVINPAGFGYSCIAMKDAIISSAIPFIEVHLSNIHKREAFRQRSVVADVVVGQISGFKEIGYLLAVSALAEMTR